MATRDHRGRKEAVWHGKTRISEPRTLPRFNESGGRDVRMRATLFARRPTPCPLVSRSACAVRSRSPASPCSPRPAALRRRPEGAEHLQLVGLHRRRHDQELRERDRHQGQLRQLRHQRDPARQARRRPDRLRHRRPRRALREDADRGRPAAEARPLQAQQLEQPRPGAAQAARHRRPGQPVPGRLALGLRHGRHQRAQGQGGARRPADAGERLEPDLRPEVRDQAEGLRRQLPRLGLRGAAGGAALCRQAALQRPTRPTTTRRRRCSSRCGRT